MLKRRHAALLATMVGTFPLAAVTASGCGGDDSATTSSDSGPDQSAADTGAADTRPGTDSGSSSNDSGVVDTGAAADTGTTDTGAAADTAAADTGGGGAADSGPDSGPVDSGSLDSQADTGSVDAGADTATSDASDGAVACATSLSELDDAGGLQLLFGFDDSTTNVSGWIPESDNDSADSGVGAGTTVAYSAVHGRTCPGSIAVTMPFTQFGTLVQSGLQFNFGAIPSLSNWTGATKLHFWVRVAAPDGAAALDYTTINGVASYAQWNGYSVTVVTSSEVTGTTLSDGAFHEIVIALDNPSFADAGTEFPGNNASKLAIQLQVAAASGSSSAPTTTVLDVDDIWLE